MPTTLRYSSSYAVSFRRASAALLALLAATAATSPLHAAQPVQVLSNAYVDVWSAGQQSLAGAVNRPDGNQDAFVWTSSGGFTILSRGSFDSTQATQASDDGSVVVGEGSIRGEEGIERAIVYTNGVIQVLTQTASVNGLTPLDDAQASMVSGDGNTIIVFTRYSNGRHFASKWTATAGLQLLPVPEKRQNQRS